MKTFIDVKAVLLVVALLALVKCDRLDDILAKNSQICGRSLSSNALESRIVGGSNALPYQFPWQISLRRYSPRLKIWYHTCGGAVIDSEWILTAAHCTMRNTTTEILRVRVGEYNYNVTEGYEQDLNVSKIITHTGFSMATIDNDINLLKLATPIDFNATNSKVVPICVGKDFWVDKMGKYRSSKTIATNDTKDTEEMTTKVSVTTTKPVITTAQTHFVSNKICVSSGWGRLSWEGSFPTILKQVKVDLVDFEYCSKVYKNIVNVTDGMMCSGKKGKGTCSGDSGGPLQCLETSDDNSTSDQGRWSLYGLTSWAVGCAENRFPSVAARVVKFRDWIADRIVEHQ